MIERLIYSPAWPKTAVLVLTIAVIAAMGSGTLSGPAHASGSASGAFENVALTPPPILSTSVFPRFAGKSNNVSGKTVTGDVIGLASTSIVIEIAGTPIEILTNGETAIHEPPDVNVGMGAITLDPLRRVVVKVDQDFLDDNGSVNDAIFTAESIMIIPRRVTRQHKRTVVTQVSTQGVAAIDSQGKSINAAAGSAVKIGDSVVMLVQKGRAGTGKAKFLAQTTDVDRRLDRLSLEFTDPIIDSGLEDLTAKRLDAEGKCLRQTLDVAPAGNRSLVSQALDRVRIDREAKEKKGGDSQGLGRAALDCIQGILGAPPKGLDQLDADQRDQVNAKCLDIAPPAKPPTVHITAPTDGSSVTEGATITIAAETSGGGSVTSVVFTVDGDA